MPALGLDFFEKNFSGKASALGVERGGAAIDVVIAGAAGGEFEVSQAEGFLGEEAEEILSRGGHEILG